MYQRELLNRFRNPKRGPQQKNKLPLYEYYAGYTEEFVVDIIDFLSLGQSAIILDPWNGSGTTIQTANRCGHSSVGYDINPVMVIVAKAGLLDSSVQKSIPSIARDIISKAKRYRLRNVTLPGDSLTVWMTNQTVEAIRRIERAIQQLLLPSSGYTPLAKLNDFSQISSLAAFYYVALFRVTRDLLAPFRGSNPTWIKKAHSDSEKLDFESKTVYDMYVGTVNEMASNIIWGKVHIGTNDSVPRVDIGVATSEALPLHNGSVDAVITSPPYCTRIDYAVATQAELAILGYSLSDIKKLRMQMIGTPTVKPEILEPRLEWSEDCLRILEMVRQHPSKASKSYYYKHFLQYFDSMYKSFREIDRVLKEGGHCTLVVQNSYYKDIEIDLALIFGSMARSYNWSPVERVDYTAKRTFATINRRANVYKTSRRTVETVLIFRKVASASV